MDRLYWAVLGHLGLGGVRGIVTKLLVRLLHSPVVLGKNAGMFIKTNKLRRAYRTYEYLPLVEGYRDEQGRPRQRTLYRLGEAGALRESGELDRIVAALSAHAERRYIDVEDLEAVDAPWIGGIATVRTWWGKLELEGWADVSLTVNRGDFVAMLGRSGAGKTTLAKHFNGLLRPTEGDVAVHGASTRGQKLSQLARNVGYCYQNPDHQIFSSTMEREVRFGPENLGLKGEEFDKAVDHALELVRLSSSRHEHPFLLGRGQRQLLAVASVLAIGAPVLVIDEPTTGMGHQGATAIMALLAEWNAQGRTIVVITHDMDVVAEYVPRSVVMAHGDLIADGPTLDVLREGDVLAEARLEAPPPGADVRADLRSRHPGLWDDRTTRQRDQRHDGGRPCRSGTASTVRSTRRSTIGSTLAPSSPGWERCSRSLFASTIPPSSVRSTSVCCWLRVPRSCGLSTSVRTC